MARDVTFHLPEETAARLEAMAKREGRSLSETGARSLEEWLRQEEFPEIEFRTFNGERRACLQGLTQIWQLIMVARGYDFDIEKTAYYFQVAPHRIEAAFKYYRAFPDESDRAIAENEAITFEDVKRLLPHANLIIVDLDPKTDEALI